MEIDHVIVRLTTGVLAKTLAPSWVGVPQALVTLCLFMAYLTTLPLKVKAKFTLAQATKTQTGISTALLLL